MLGNTLHLNKYIIPHIKRFCNRISHNQVLQFCVVNRCDPFCEKITERKHNAFAAIQKYQIDTFGIWDDTLKCVLLYVRYLFVEQKWIFTEFSLCPLTKYWNELSQKNKKNKASDTSENEEEVVVIRLRIARFYLIFLAKKRQKKTIFGIY